METVVASPDSTPLDLSPTMAEAEQSQALMQLTLPKTEATPDVDRFADREAVAVAMVMDLTKASGFHPARVHSDKDAVSDTDDRSPRKKQRKKPREEEKVCLVCGDKALAHNFDAITCESCKAFFRRNALKRERSSCLFKGNCIITLQTRRFCPSCRLRKCFDVGMRADLILDDGERRARMQKVVENRAKRFAQDSTDDTSDSQVGSSCQPYLHVTETERDDLVKSINTSPSPVFHGTYLQNELQQQKQVPLSTLVQESSMSYITASTPQRNAMAGGAPPAFQAKSQPAVDFFEQLQQLHQQNQQMQQQSPLHIFTADQLQPVTSPATCDFQHVSRDLLPSDPHMYWRLSEEEKTLITQLSSAYQDTIMTLPERVPFGEGSVCGFHDLANPTRAIETIFESAEKNMRQMVTFVQRLGDFQLLRQDDQIALLQASGMQTTVLRWASLYVVERDSWLSRFGEASVSNASRIFGNEEMLRQMANFCSSVKTVLKNDVTLYVLLHCLILFDPQHSNLVDRQLINTFKDKYIILLKHYLESEYSFMYAERYVRVLFDKLVEFRPMAERSMCILRQFKEFVPPLMKQMLNLHDPS